MAAKKKAAAPAETAAAKVTKAVRASKPVIDFTVNVSTTPTGGKVVKDIAITDARIVAGQEIDAETALRDAKEAAVKEERTKVKADPDGDIDERLAALLKDHEAMGARPK